MQVYLARVIYEQVLERIPRHLEAVQYLQQSGALNVRASDFRRQFQAGVVLTTRRATGQDI